MAMDIRYAAVLSYVYAHDMLSFLVKKSKFGNVRIRHLNDLSLWTSHSYSFGILFVGGFG